jgi:hypothetical protein
MREVFCVCERKLMDGSVLYSCTAHGNVSAQRPSKILYRNLYSNTDFCNSGLKIGPRTKAQIGGKREKARLKKTFPDNGEKFPRNPA